MCLVLWKFYLCRCILLISTFPAGSDSKTVIGLNLWKRHQGWVGRRIINLISSLRLRPNAQKFGEVSWGSLQMAHFRSLMFVMYVFCVDDHNVCALRYFSAGVLRLNFWIMFLQEISPLYCIPEYRDFSTAEIGFLPNLVNLKGKLLQNMPKWPYCWGG